MESELFPIMLRCAFCSGAWEYTQLPITPVLQLVIFQKEMTQKIGRFETCVIWKSACGRVDRNLWVVK